MGERKGTNHYYPPDFDPKKHGSLNGYHGTHALRERARKLDKGILIIRFELPYNIWCGGCGNHVGMGVRYNAEKTKVGNYYTTPIYRFKMKCHLCDNRFEIETDPKNCEYVIVSGARRKEERWEPSATETIELQEKEEKDKMMADAMFKLEHGVQDKAKLKAVAPTLSKIVDIQTQWKDDFAINQLMRKKFREEKKELLLQKQSDDTLLAKGSLDIKLLDETAEDIEKANRIKYKNKGFDAHQRKRRLEIKSGSLFGTDSKHLHLDPQQVKKRKTIEKRLQMIITTSNKALMKSSFDPVMTPKKLADKLGVVTKPKNDCAPNEVGLFKHGVESSAVTDEQRTCFSPSSSKGEAFSTRNYKTLRKDVDEGEQLFQLTSRVDSDNQDFPSSYKEQKLCTDLRGSRNEGETENALSSSSSDVEQSFHSQSMQGLNINTDVNGIRYTEEFKNQGSNTHSELSWQSNKAQRDILECTKPNIQSSVNAHSTHRSGLQLSQCINEDKLTCSELYLIPEVNQDSGAQSLNSARESVSVPPVVLKPTGSNAQQSSLVLCDYDDSSEQSSDDENTRL